MTVDFMVIGAQKCGTTTLYDVLSSHPAIVGSNPKEPHYFSTAPDWRSELDRYERMFSPRQNALYFEASTSYTFYPLRKLEIWEDLYEYNSQLRFIYVVRNPLDRIVSNYMHMFQRGYTAKTLEDELTSTPFYLDVSRYATQIQPYIERFGEDQVKVLFFEDLAARPERVFSQLAAFLGIAEDGFRNQIAAHSNRSVGAARVPARYDNALMWRLHDHAPFLWRLVVGRRVKRLNHRPQMLPLRQRAVIRMLEREINELEQLTGRDLGSWRTIQDSP